MVEMCIGFSRAKSPLAIASKGILFYQGWGGASHSYIKFYWPSVGGFLIYQASKGLVNFYNEELFHEHNIILDEFKVNLSDETALETKKFAYKNLGKKYGKLQLLGFLISDICKNLNIPIKENIFGNKSQQYVCTELVANIMKECWNFDINEDLELLTPKRLHEIVKELVGNDIR